MHKHRRIAYDRGSLTEHANHPLRLTEAGKYLELPPDVFNDFTDTTVEAWVKFNAFANRYLLDVCGHGVQSALISVSILNVLRTQSLPHCDFRDPGAVVSHLNDMFLMEGQDQIPFTIWYGVYSTARRELKFSGAGHPPAFLLTGPDNAPASCQHFGSEGPMTGVIEGMVFTNETAQIAPGSRLYLYSDGVYEIHRQDGTMWTFAEFEELMIQPLASGESALDRLQTTALQLQGGQPFHDDFSIVELQFA